MEYTLCVIGGQGDFRHGGKAYSVLQVMGSPPPNKPAASPAVKMWLGAWLNAKAFEMGKHGHVIENFPFSSQRIKEASMQGDTAMAEFLAKFMQSETA